MTSTHCFAGAIPDSFGTAENLKVFDVKLNNFTAFPSAWTNASYNSINSSYSNIRASFNSISVSPQLLKSKTVKYGEGVLYSLSYLTVCMILHIATFLHNKPFCSSNSSQF